MRILLFIILVLLMSVLPVSSQNISVKTFVPDEMYQTANLQDTMVFDQNGDKCALIKIMTPATGFTYDVGSLGVTHHIQKPGEMVVCHKWSTQNSF